jgi:transposase InsO family protein
LLVLIRASYTASGGVYGARRVFLDLREVGETCGRHGVAPIMRVNGIRALHGYKIPRGPYGRPSIIAPNKLQREFNVEQPDREWVTDIVRHEAPYKRVEVKDLHPLAVAATGEKLRAARPRRCGERVGSGPDNAVTGWYC